MQAATSDSRVVRMITFRLDSETYLLDIMRLRQIVPYNGSTVVPHAPDFVEGIIVLRSEAIPIIDLRRRLYPTLPASDRSPLVLISEIDQQTVGLKVDEVRRIVNVPLDSIIPPPELASAGGRELVVGVAELGSEVLLLLDLEAVLSPSEKHSLHESMMEVNSIPADQG